MSDKVRMQALLTIPKRGMVCGEEYDATPQEARDDEQFGRGKPVEVKAAPAAAKPKAR